MVRGPRLMRETLLTFSWIMFTVCSLRHDTRFK